jgi:hypothetical protein
MKQTVYLTLLLLSIRHERAVNGLPRRKKDDITLNTNSLARRAKLPTSISHPEKSTLTTLHDEFPCEGANSELGNAKPVNNRGRCTSKEESDRQDVCIEMKSGERHSENSQK